MRRCALLLLAAVLAIGAAPPDAGPAPPDAGVAPSDAGTPGAPAAPSTALQNAALSRALFLLNRDACPFVEDGAPMVPSWQLDPSFNLAPKPAHVSRCAADVPVTALLAAAGTALALAQNKELPSAPIAKDNGLAAADKAVLALTGKALVKKAGVLDGDAMRATFALLYVKPSETRLGLGMQKLYDAALKDAFARLAMDVAALVQNKARLASEAKKLLAKPADQGGNDAWRMAMNGLVKSDEDAARIDPRLAGFVLRRQADGTLPVVLELLRTVLLDYDPKSAAKLPSP